MRLAVIVHRNPIVRILNGSELSQPKIAKVAPTTNDNDRELTWTRGWDVYCHS